MGTRYEVGDIVKVDGRSGKHEVTDITDRDSNSPQYRVKPLRSTASYKQADWLRASDLKKAKNGSDWKSEAVEELERIEGVELEIHDTNVTGGTRRGTFSAVAVDSSMEFEVFKDYDTARITAISRLEEDIDMNPNLVQDWVIQDHSYIGATDRRMIAQDEARNRLEIADVEEMRNLADWHGVEFKEYDDPEVTKEKNREDIEIAISEDIQDKLEKDPIGYFVEERGIYTKEELMEQSFMRLDAREAAETVVQNDGLEMAMSLWGERYDLSGDTIAFEIQ